MMDISFIDLTAGSVILLFLIGFVGGLVSGFIGSGGAFVLTPAMMNMGVTAIMAVASNMAHKFPKAFVGAMKRHKFGQVDVKLGIVLGISAEAGVLYGAGVQETIRELFGKAGSNLYVSSVFVVVLAIVGAYVLRDAYKMFYSKNPEEEKKTKLAEWVQSVHIPGTMMYFKSIDAKISVLFTIPIGFATGMLAATIAVGGFIGVPAMMYVLGVPGLIASATELVIAFIMGMGGTIKFAWAGYVDIRLAMIILAGSLFGVQLGAIGTTYVKPYMVKIVMGVIMMIALMSRAVVIPVYLSELGEIDPLAPGTITILKNLSFGLLLFALTTGAVIVFKALIKGMREHRAKMAAENAVPGTFSAPEVDVVEHQLSPTGRLERIMLVTDNSEHSESATAEAINIAARCKADLFAFSVLPTPTLGSPLGQNTMHDVEKKAVVDRLLKVRKQAEAVGVSCEILLGHGEEPFAEIVDQAEDSSMDIIVMGRSDTNDLVRSMVGSTAEKVIGHTHSDVLVVPQGGKIEGKGIILPVDGSRYSDAAAVTVQNLVKQCSAPVTIVSVAVDERLKEDAIVHAEKVHQFMKGNGLDVKVDVRVGTPSEAIVASARENGADLIVLGSHGRTGLDRLLIGSVSERVIGNADCPVMVVKL
ncbi:permease [Solemya velum gill symbiont]|nr:permease [Solemya velum gill symbiont]OOY39951.1 permease [Solemya velum gill symbiont]OOY45988.1 permease [Solemya velum gill symbiont]OOY47160.1 permease [Solemya velum gill symbiont]OOY50808.1 permease [Solemya velum gill symbiont]